MTGSSPVSPLHDWASIAARLAPVEVSSDPTVVRRKSRDFFWFSPILNEALKARFGDIVAMPASTEELRHCLAVAFAHDLPIVPRGGGTGNYGQAVP